MFARFISSMSRIIVSRSSVRPVSGWCSCRFTPWKVTGRPFTRKTPSTISTRRKPTARATVSVSSTAWPSERSVPR